MVNIISIRRLEIARIIIRIITIVASVGLVPLTFFAPWSSEQILEDYGTYGYYYTVYHFNIYLALAYFLPVIALLATNGSVKRHFKRLRTTTVSSIQVSPTQTVLITQNRSQSQQQHQQIKSVTIRHCIICGQPNDFDSKYCGNQL